MDIKLKVVAFITVISILVLSAVWIISGSNYGLAITLLTITFAALLGLFVNNYISRRKEISELIQNLRKWRNSDRSQSFSRSNLQGTDLSEMNLKGIDLSNSNLKLVKFQSTNLVEADLRDSDLRKADLSGANLDKAKLSKANMTKAMLHKTKLHQAELFSTNLCRADLTKASRNMRY